MKMRLHVDTELCCGCGNCFYFFAKLRLDAPKTVLFDDEEVERYQSDFDVIVPGCYLEAITIIEVNDEK
jgi:ferredoxin